jgi:ABC-type sugar transport system permease subunit
MCIQVKIRIVKWIGVETMKVWLDLDPSNLQAFVWTSVYLFFVLHLHLILGHTYLHWLNLDLDD